MDRHIDSKFTEYTEPLSEPREDTSLTLHEAAKKGDMSAVQQFLDKKKPLDAQEHCLGWQKSAIRQKASMYGHIQRCKAHLPLMHMSAATVPEDGSRIEPASARRRRTNWCFCRVW